MRRLWLLVPIFALTTVTTAPPAGAMTPCQVGYGLGAEIAKGPVHVGEHTDVSAVVTTSGPWSTYPANCPLTNVDAVATFANGTTKTLVANGSVAAGPDLVLFTKNVKVKKAYVIDDSTYGPLFRVSVSMTAVSDGVPLDAGPATYAVAVN